ncbi:S53 family peptidase [Paludibacterium yongneupense]|uniref:S53 family peptidase n=1 Tax=Paludibacterium yongneupense TaxID=400061 RepID=UPI0003FACBDE|nr:S53 family peptidase [Paludibacterium yongneupense]
MKISSVIGRVGVPTLALCLMAPCVYAGEEWVATQTAAFRVPERASMLGMRELPPGAPIRIAVNLRLHDKAQLDALVASVQREGGGMLTHEQFMRRFAPSAAQAEAVASYLRRAGFVDVRIAPNRVLVTATGSAASVQTAFHTALHRFSLDGEEHYANAGAAMVPASLGGTVLAVLGLQNVSHARPLFRLAVPEQGQGQGKSKDKGKGKEVVGHSPLEFAALYGAGKTPDAGAAMVGIISAGDLSQTLSDLNLFTDKNRLDPVSVSVVQSGSGSTDSSGTMEWDLDSQSIVGAGGGRVLEMLFYNASSLYDQDLVQAYNQAVSDNQAAVINVSLGECEDDAAASGAMASEDQIFEVAMAQGQTFSVSSGDSGSNECSGSTATHQSYPAVSPYVMAIGGTTLTTDGGHHYLGETVWQGSGGGASGLEARPAWQSGVAAMRTNRGVPDLAFDADPASGAVIMYNGADAQVGGTSLSAPIFTGIWARLQSAKGKRPGFPGPWVYAAGSSGKRVYRDITSGSNGAYQAGKGWDFTTGWGSILIEPFAAYLRTVTGSS